MANIHHTKGAPSPGGAVRVFIAIPTYDGKITAPCAKSLFDAISHLIEKGIGYEVFIMAGNCHVDDARNGCVREFMQSECTDLFFIDADVGFEGYAIAHLLGMDKDIVAGVYPKKHEDIDFPVTVPPSTDLYADQEGCVEVLGAPTGFMRIRRNALEKLWEANKHRRFIGQKDTQESFPYTIIFERTYENGHRYSGDYAFCRKWQELGGKVYVYPELFFSHEGSKEWCGTLGSYWRDKHGVTEQRFSEAITRLRNGDMSNELFVWLIEGWGNHWAVDASCLLTLFVLALETKGTILECGSGVSTIVLAIAAERTGAKLVTLENDSMWAFKVSETLSKYDLCHTVTPTKIQDFDGYSWYDYSTEKEIDMVFCDGPPRGIGRAGIVHRMKDKLLSATVLMDDTEDSHHQEIMSTLANGRKVESYGKFSWCKGVRDADTKI